MDFLNNITSSMTKASKSGEVADVIQTMQKMVLGGKKRFTHGNNVIMIRGTHKGYYGYVNPDEFQPARYEIEIEEEQYIPVGRYGDIEVGKEIGTEFGKSTIINRIPKLLEIETSDKTNLRFMETDLMRVVFYTEGGELKMARLDNVEKLNGELNCEITSFKVNSIKSEGDGLQKLSEMIKGSSLKDLFDSDKKKERCEIINVKFPEYYFVITKPNNETDKSYLGTFGKFTRVIPEQYLIKHKKTIYMMPSNIKPKSGSKKIKGELVDIVKGAFKGKTGKIIKKFEPRLVVYIEAAGKRVTEHYVKEGDEFVLAPITPKDVFYMDLKLKNGNDFEVRDITQNGNFVGVERGKNFRTTEIKPDDVLMYQPGFSVTGVDAQIAKMDESYVSDDTQYVSDEQEEDVYEDEEGEGEGEVSYDEDRTTGDEEGDEYGFSYKDVERMTYQPKGLTSEESDVKAKINRIIRNYGINESEINIYGMIESVMEIIKKLKSKLSETEEFKNTWVQSDEKYIIGCVVFYEIIRSGMEYLFVDNFNDIVGSYISTLASNKYFLPNDVKNTILLKKGWSSNITMNENLIKTLKKNKDYNSMYLEMFKNCEKYLSTFMEIPDIEKVSKVLTMEKLIPVGVHKTKRQRELEMENEPYVKKFVYASDVMSDNIPETATKILWDPSYESILERFRGRLMEKINSEKSNKSTKIVYEYVLDKLEQAPFELKKMENILQDKHLKIDQVKYDTLNMVWGELLNYIKRQMQLNRERREIKQTKKQQEKEKEMSKRRVAMELTGNMKTLGLESDSDEDMSTESTNQKRQRRK